MGGGVMNGKDRAEAGCIVTFVETTTGQTRAVHGSGTYAETSRSLEIVGVRMVLASLLEQADGWDGDWKVQSICTPSTILSDLKGRNAKYANVPDPPELQMLSSIGRPDMWHGKWGNHSKARGRARRRAERAA